MVNTVISAPLCTQMHTAVCGANRTVMYPGLCIARSAQMCTVVCTEKCTDVPGGVHCAVHDDVHCQMHCSVHCGDVHCHAHGDKHCDQHGDAPCGVRRDVHTIVHWHVH